MQQQATTTISIPANFIIYQNLSTLTAVTQRENDTLTMAQR